MTWCPLNMYLFFQTQLSSIKDVVDTEVELEPHESRFVNSQEIVADSPSSLALLDEDPYDLDALLASPPLRRKKLGVKNTAPTLRGQKNIKDHQRRPLSEGGQPRKTNTKPLQPNRAIAGQRKNHSTQLLSKICTGFIVLQCSVFVIRKINADS